MLCNRRAETEMQAYVHSGYPFHHGPANNLSDRLLSFSQGCKVPFRTLSWHNTCSPSELHF